MSPPFGYSITNTAPIQKINKILGQVGFCQTNQRPPPKPNTPEFQKKYKNACNIY